LVASKITMPIRSIADEAAQKAKELRLQSLREKVHGKKDQEESGAKKGDAATDAAAEAPPAPAASEEAFNRPDGSPTRSSEDSGGSKPPAGLQSPTTATWKTPSSPENLREILQSPTSTSWLPTGHFESGSVTSLHGSLVENASEEEIAAIERAETIKEDPDAEAQAEKEEEEESRRRSLVVEDSKPA
jgi:hypothetical protein